MTGSWNAVATTKEGDTVYKLFLEGSMGFLHEFEVKT